MENWQFLVPHLEQFLEESNDIQKFFTIIKDTLIFINKGLVSSEDISSSKLQSLNLWLHKSAINAGIHNAGNSEIFEAALDLQKTLLLAYRTKNPSLFQPITLAYIEFARDLAGNMKAGKTETKFVFVKDLSCLEDFQLQPDAALISFSSKDQLETAALGVLEFLKHLVSMLHIPLEQELSGIALGFFQHGSMAVKVKSLELFSSILQRQDSCRNLDVILSFAAIPSEHLVPAFHEFLMSLKQTSALRDSFFQRRLNALLLGLLSSCIESRHSPLSKLLVRELTTQELPKEARNLLKHAVESPKVLFLFRMTVVKELQRGEDAWWDAIKQHIVQEITKDDRSSRDIGQLLYQWKVIFSFVQTVYEDFERVSRGSPKNLEFLSDQLKTFLPEVLRRIQQNTSDISAVLLEFSYAVCRLNDTKFAYKRDFLNVIMSPLCEKASSKVPKAIQKCLGSPPFEDSKLAWCLKYSLVLSVQQNAQNKETSEAFLGITQETMKKESPELRSACVRSLIPLLYATMDPKSVLKWTVFRQREELNEEYAAVLEDLVNLLDTSAHTLKVVVGKQVEIKVVTDEDLLKQKPNKASKSPKELLTEYLQEHSATEILSKLPQTGLVEVREALKHICLNLDLANPRVAVEFARVFPKILAAVGPTDQSLLQKWLQTLLSTDINVLKQLCDTYSQVLDILGTQPLPSFVSLFLKNFGDAMDNSLFVSPELQSYVVHVLSKVGQSKVVDERGLLTCVMKGMIFVMKRESRVQREATFYVESMMEAHNLRPRQVLLMYRPQLLHVIVEIAVTNIICYRTPIKLVDSCHLVSRVFEYASVKDFLVSNNKLMFAVIVALSVQEVGIDDLWLELGEVLLLKTNIEPQSALISSFFKVFSFAFVNFSEEVALKCTDFVVRKSGTAVCDIVKKLYESLSEILVFFHASQEMALRIFQYFCNTQDKKTAMEAMSKYISETFQGILCSFENFITSSESEKTVKKNALLSLGSIIRFVGSEKTTSNRFKIMALLNTATAKNEDYLDRACIEVWDTFIRTVDVFKLGTLLSSIVASLKPLIDRHPEHVDPILRYLFVSNENTLGQHLRDLFFIDDLDVRNDLKKIIKRHRKNSQLNATLLDQLVEHLRYIRHENMVVRTYGVRHLSEVFRSRRQELSGLVMSHQTADPVLVSVLKSLMSCCKEKAPELQILAAECIGELGAIEPTFLPPDNYESQRRFALGVDTDEFAILALTELCRAYQVQADTKGVDCFALSIQEILIHRKVDPRRFSKMNIWQAIPERMRSLMEPLLSSQYVVVNPEQKNLSHPIFGSSNSLTFEDWIFSWAGKMIQNMSCPQTRELLGSFRHSIRRDPNTLALVFPFVVLHAIQKSSPRHVTEMVEELTAVFKSVAYFEEGRTPMSQNREELLEAQQREIHDPNLEIWDSCLEQENVSDQESMTMKCARTAFGVFDFLQQWVQESNALKVTQPRTQSTDGTLVKSFIGKFDSKLISLANFKCREFARALFYLERYINEDFGTRFQEQLPLLAKIYAELFDPDSVEGLMTLKANETTLDEQILLYNATNRLHEAIACFERLIQVGRANPDTMKELINCYLSLDQPEMALLFSESSSADSVEMKATRAEPLWRLSRWDDLDELLKEKDVLETDSWGVSYGQLLLNLRSQKHEEFDQNLHSIRKSLLKPFASHENEQSIYQKCYPQVLKLHMLTEIQKVSAIVQTRSSFELPSLTAFLKDFMARNDVLQPTATVMEPILCLRRILLQELRELLCQEQQQQPLVTQIRSKINDNIRQLWMQSTELASKAKLYHQAELYILNAETYKPKELFIQKAKLFWEKGAQGSCFKILEMGINEMMQAVGGEVSKLSDTDKKLLGEAKLLMVEYNAKSMNANSEILTACFNDALKIHQTEHGLVQYAQHLRRCHAAMSDEDRASEAGGKLLMDQIIFWGKSLVYGSNYVYQSMPAMLTIWLDYTMGADRRDSPIGLQMNSWMTKLSETLPLFTFFTAFSQLTSRICHPNSSVFKILKVIIAKLISKYPQQSLWMIIPVSKSMYEMRVKRCSEILSDRSLSPHSTLISSMRQLIDLLRSLTDADISRRTSNEMTVETLCPELIKFFKSRTLVEIILPIQKQLSLRLPSSHDRTDFNPFPDATIFISGVQSKVSIMASLLKPKRISLTANDGNEYGFLLKPKDDLRKDFRLMEFNGVVKKFLHQDIDARQRRLNIRTYAVLPLDDECGIIEWVSNLVTFRTILMNLYKTCGKGMPSKTIKDRWCLKRDSLEKKKESLEKIFMSHHPAIFDEWFVYRFPNPHSWYQARNAYIKTLAVMSVAGYILGLGDRHGDNILLDSSTGDIVHVDFGCLFNKGEKLEWPELIPFRLTHNLVQAMGPQGVEGLFRKSCEITMRVLNSQKATLMSILRPFIYDPMVNWAKTVRKNPNYFEQTDEHAKLNLERVSDRLNGFVMIDGKRTNLALSIEGHVNHLINEATDIKNLCQMFWGWGPFY